MTTVLTNVLPIPDIQTAISTRFTTLDTLKTHEIFDKMPFFEMNQVHGTAVFEVLETTPIDLKPEVDAIWTTSPNRGLVVRTADCLPILFVMTGKQPLIGGIHAGRRSTEGKITEKTLNQCTQGRADFHFHIWMGPAICQKCYQIDPVHDRHFDLIAENEAQIAATIDPTYTTIYRSEICTSCQNDRFFSYRREGVAAGRFYSVIGMGGTLTH